MMDRLVVWTKVWRPLLISRRPSNVYDLPHWPNSGTPNPGRRNLQCMYCVSEPESVFKIVRVKSKKWEEGWGKEKEKELIFTAVETQTSFLGTKGGREAGSQAVPLLHLTAVQNDSWRLPHRHHGRADVAAAFQVQQHLIPPFLLSVPLFFSFLFLFFFCLQVNALPTCLSIPRYLPPITLCLSPSVTQQFAYWFNCTPISLLPSLSTENSGRGNRRRFVPEKRSRSDAKRLFSCRQRSPCSLPACTCGKEVIQLSPSWGTADYSLAHIRHYSHSG